jgi:hypothetical protein
MVQIGGGFASLHLLNDGVDRRLLQRLIAIGSVDHHFDFLIAFAGPGEIGDKIMGACHAAVLEGWGGLAGFGPAGRRTADR